MFEFFTIPVTDFVQDNRGLIRIVVWNLNIGWEKLQLTAFIALIETLNALNLDSEVEDWKFVNLV